MSNLSRPTIKSFTFAIGAVRVAENHVQAACTAVSSHGDGVYVAEHAVSDDLTTNEVCMMRRDGLNLTQVDINKALEEWMVALSLVRRLIPEKPQENTNA